VKNDEGGIDLTTDGCLECGTCRIICQGNNNLEWDYPRGGFGISFKFG
jgi:ferredoxin like protein